MKNLVLGLFILLGCGVSAQNFTLDKTVFADTIIRSYSYHKPLNQLIIGTKGQNPGSAYLFTSFDKGESWQPLNNDRALCDSCEDIQSIIQLNSSHILAGTWKNGLFLSANSGKHFKKIENFPSNDIRSFASVNSRVYAATTTHGILASADNGLIWESLHADSLNRFLASWFICNDSQNQNRILACSFSNGIVSGPSKDEEWKSVQNLIGYMIWDITFSSNRELFAVASNDSLSYIIKRSAKGEWSSNEIGIRSANSIEYFESKDEDCLLIGSWSSGIYKMPLNNSTNSLTEFEQLISNDSIGTTKILQLDPYLFDFSWGSGVRRFKKISD